MIVEETVLKKLPVVSHSMQKNCRRFINTKTGMTHILTSHSCCVYSLMLVRGAQQKDHQRRLEKREHRHTNNVVVKVTSDDFTIPDE